MGSELRHSKRLIRASVVLAIVGVVIYVLLRSIFVAYANYSPVEKVLAVLFLFSEVFVMFHAIGYFLQIYRLNRPGGGEGADRPERRSEPPVAILIPARHEPGKVLETTLISCYNLKYPNKTVYLLDDSSEEKFKQEAEELARAYNARLFRRTTRHGAKAGIINDCVTGLTDTYIAVFDVDQNPMPTFLSELVDMLERDPKLALVQTPQFYSNAVSSKVAFAAQMQQAVFYEYVCDGKNTNEAMICCGTNVVIRRAALEDVGGLDESSVTEDFATSFSLHRKGWKTRYYNHVSTFGMGPEDLGSYFKQQNRWALGNVGMFKKILGVFFRSPRLLSGWQWFDYMITSSYYLIGWAYGFLLLCPVIYILFNVPSFFMNPAVYSLTFFPYFILSLAIFYSTMGLRRYTPAQMFQGQALTFLTQPVFMRASLNGLLGAKGTFQVTAKEGGRVVPYRMLWPQLAIWGINLAALTWGINRFRYEQTGAILINVAWILYHCILLSSIFYFNEE